MAKRTVNLTYFFKKQKRVIGHAISTSSSSYESTVDNFDGDYDEAEETSCSDVTPGTSGSPNSLLM